MKIFICIIIFLLTPPAFANEPKKTTNEIKLEIFLPPKINCTSVVPSPGRFELVPACTQENCELYFVDTCSGEVSSVEGMTEKQLDEFLKFMENEGKQPSTILLP